MKRYEAGKDNVNYIVFLDGTKHFIGGSEALCVHSRDGIDEVVSELNRLYERVVYLNNELHFATGQVDWISPTTGYIFDGDF